MNRYFKIECYSLGGETVMGVISKEQYDYWTQKQLENKWDKRCDLIGNSSTQSTQMNLYKGS